MEAELVADAGKGGCPYARYRAMREEAAVVEVAPNTFAVTRFRDCKAILADWKTYSAVVGANNLFEIYGPSSVRDEIDTIMRDYKEEPVLMRCDPPAHSRARNLVSRTLLPSVIEKLEPGIRATVDEFAAPWIGKGEVDFAAEFAEPVPNAVTTRFLGSPPAMREKMKFWAQETMSRLDGPQSPARQLEVARNITEMADYFFDGLAERRRRPSDDLMSLLAHAEIEGDRLEDKAIVNVISTFLVGGHETTTFLMGNSFWRLARDPTLAQHLRANPQEIPSFVEEMLRIEPPAQAILRSPTRDVEIGGVKIRAGATLRLTIASANRDPEAFDAPEELRVDRFPKPPGGHLAFGSGIHACIGLNLARAEARIACAALLPRMLDIAPASDDPVEFAENFMLLGPTRLDLRFTPA